MEPQEYIESGMLELYVAGLLSEEENLQVYEMMRSFPEIRDEVEAIEAAIRNLTSEVAKDIITPDYEAIRNRLKGPDSGVVNISKGRTPWLTYTGWAAAIAIGAGLLFTLDQKGDLENEISDLERERIRLELEIEAARLKVAEQQDIISVFRSQDIISVPLSGQGSFESTYATVYWNKADNTIYFDGIGLPPAPAGKVYQLWSLKLDPLTPTSLGTIDDFNTDDNKIFIIENPNDSQAFGVTLEPEGGSESPTMEQLYTLGVVGSP